MEMTLLFFIPVLIMIMLLILYIRHTVASTKKDKDKLGYVFITLLVMLIMLILHVTGFMDWLINLSMNISKKVAGE